MTGPQNQIQVYFGNVLVIIVFDTQISDPKRHTCNMQVTQIYNGDGCHPFNCIMITKIYNFLHQNERHIYFHRNKFIFFDIAFLQMWQVCNGLAHWVQAL